MTGTECGLFTHKSVPVIFESPCIMLYNWSLKWDCTRCHVILLSYLISYTVIALSLLQFLVSKLGNGEDESI
jgi:hypothetical protein